MLNLQFLYVVLNLFEKLIKQFIYHFPLDWKLFLIAVENNL